MEYIPCKNIDHNQEKYPSCELKSCGNLFPNVKYFEREAPYDGAATKVQFCGAGRGRINSVFGCYGEESCYEASN